MNNGLRRMRPVLHKQMHYLDYVSTTPLSKEVFSTYTDLLSKYYANSESMHDLGREISNLVEKSRKQIANFFGVETEEIIFTSGASEANNTALKSVCWAIDQPTKHIITTAYEHSSIMEATKQLHDVFHVDITYLKPDKNGQVTLEQVKKVLQPDTVLVSIMMVNNEIGAINPVYEIAEYIKKHSKAYFHVDAVQALGKLPISLKNIDLMSLSMHKIYGLKGSGILIKKKHVPLVPLISGGQQEHGHRGGTIDSCTDIMAAKTIRLALESQKEHFEYVSTLQQYLFEKLSSIEGIQFNSKKEYSPFIFNFSYPNIKSEVMMNALNLKGYALSAQSTCHSRNKQISHVYHSMDFDLSRAESAIRIGLSHLVTIEELDGFIEALKGIIEQYG